MPSFSTIGHSSCLEACPKQLSSQVLATVPTSLGPGCVGSVSSPLLPALKYCNIPCGYQELIVLLLNSPPLPCLMTISLTDEKKAFPSRAVFYFSED